MVDRSTLQALVRKVETQTSAIDELSKQVKELAENKYYTVPELAQHLRTTTATVYAKIKAGLLNKDKNGSSTIIHQRDLNQYLQAGNTIKRTKKGRRKKLDDESLLF